MFENLKSTFPQKKRKKKPKKSKQKKLAQYVHFSNKNTSKSRDQYKNGEKTHNNRAESGIPEYSLV